MAISASLREAARDCPHRSGVRVVERRAIGLRIGLIALRERVDQRLLARRCARARGAARSPIAATAGALAFGSIGDVDVRPERPRFAPEAHRALRVELLRLAESAQRLVVVEAPREPITLIEELLRELRRRGDLHRRVAQTRHQRRIVG